MKWCKALKKVKYPVNIGGFSATIITVFVAYNVLLLNKEVIRKANTKLNFQLDKFSIFRNRV